MTTTFTQESQSLTPSAKIALFRLDVSSIGGPVVFFTTSVLPGETSVIFGGQAYTPIDISIEGFEVNAGGVLPTPKMKIANSDLFIQSLINQFGDLAGCELRRVRTYARFLDGQSDADPTAFMGPDVFLVDRKTDEGPDFIEWELSAAIDQEGKMLPGRQFIRDICTRRYRTYDPTNAAAAADGFVYPKIFPCKYTGAASFDALGATTTSANDNCGRRLSDCKLRFPPNALPTGAFPGIGRVTT